MFINKKVMSLAASLMLFCTCFISQVVAIADDENLNQNASIQVFLMIKYLKLCAQMKLI